MKKLLFLVCLSLSIICLKAQNYIQYTPETITINIPDTVINNTVLKRKAHLFTMIYNQNNQTLSLTWTVRFYADSSGTYGKPLNKIIPDYIRNSIADNSTYVNPANGSIISGTPTIDYMGQYDWFNKVARDYPIIVHDMITQYGNAITNW